MTHITIEGWEYRDGRVSQAMAVENQRHFAFISRAMRTAQVSEAQAQQLYDEQFPQPRQGQRDCPDCGLWTCEAPHDGVKP